MLAGRARDERTLARSASSSLWATRTRAPATGFAERGRVVGRAQVGATTSVAWSPVCSDRRGAAPTGHIDYRQPGTRAFGPARRELHA